MVCIYRYVGVSFGIDSLTNGKEYEVLEYDADIGALRIIDDSGEDYLYDPVNPRPIADPNHPGGRFEIVEDDADNTLQKTICFRSTSSYNGSKLFEVEN